MSALWMRSYMRSCSAGTSARGRGVSWPQGNHAIYPLEHSLTRVCLVRPWARRLHVGREETREEPQAARLRCCRQSAPTATAASRNFPAQQFSLTARE